jgi:hypothetical protein
VTSVNTVGWFEVATDDPDGAQRFYGELFGWTFNPDPDAAKVGMDYRLVTYPGEERPVGGVFGTKGGFPNHAVFSIVVADVAEACASAEKLGGEVVQTVTEPEAGPAFAYLRDPAGNLFGIFSPSGQPG